MTEQQPADDSLSRRNLLMGVGAAVAAGAAFAVPTTVSAGAPPIVSGNFHPEALNAPIGGLTYLPIDGFEFQPDSLYLGTVRYALDTDGVGLNVAGELAVSLPIPAGSVIRQINVAYRGSPIINVFKRSFAPPSSTSQFISLALTPSGVGSATQSFDLAPAITIDKDASYTLRFYASPGDTIFGVSVGYVPPTQSFTPFAGAVPRALDTRVSGGKLNPGEDRLVALGNVGARSAVFNLAITDTEGAGGFVGAYSAAVTPWPGNSSINWTGAGLNLSNGVTCAVDGTGQIKIHGGANKTHVVIDMIGYLV